MGAGIAASPHCAERRICRCSHLVKTRRPQPALDPGSPAQASLSIKPLPRERSRSTYLTARPEGSLVVRSSGLALVLRSLRTQIPRRKTARCSTALLGKPPIASRFAHLPRPLRRDWRSGAASRDRKISLPAPLPGWPRNEPESPSQCLPAEIGSSVPFRPPAVAGFLGKPGRPPRSPLQHAPCPRVAKAKNIGQEAVDNGDIGNNRGTFPQRPEFDERSVVVSFLPAYLQKRA